MTHNNIIDVLNLIGESMINTTEYDFVYHPPIASPKGITKNLLDSYFILSRQSQNLHTIAYNGPDNTLIFGEVLEELELFFYDNDDILKEMNLPFLRILNLSSQQKYIVWKNPNDTESNQ
jgi:hypothetical protein